jgi:hypothetical protein
MQFSVPFLMSAIHSQGNWRLLQDPVWDALWASISEAPDHDQQIALFRQTVEYFLDEYVCPGVVYLPTYYAVSDKVGECTLSLKYDLWGKFAGIKRK